MSGEGGGGPERLAGLFGQTGSEQAEWVCPCHAQAGFGRSRCGPGSPKASSPAPFLRRHSAPAPTARAVTRVTGGGAARHRAPSAAGQSFERGAVVEQQRGAVDANQVLVLELAEEARDGLARGADELPYLLVRERELEAVFARAVAFADFEQE